MAEEARDYGHTIPRSIAGRGDCGDCDLRLPALGGAVGHARGERPHRAGDHVRGRSDPRRGEEHQPGVAAAAGGDLRRDPGRHDPVHRDQCRRDRGVAAHLLDGPAPPAARETAAAAPEVPHAVHRDHRVRPDRDHHDHPWRGRLPRQDVRVRGDALVHDRPPGGDQAAGEGTRPRAPLPRSGDADHPRPRAAAVRRVRRPRHRDRLGRRHDPQLLHAHLRHGLAAAGDRHVRPLPPQPGPDR